MFAAVHIESIHSWVEFNGVWSCTLFPKLFWLCEASWVFFFVRDFKIHISEWIFLAIYFTKFNSVDSIYSLDIIESGLAVVSVVNKCGSWNSSCREPLLSSNSPPPLSVSCTWRTGCRRSILRARCWPSTWRARPGSTSRSWAWSWGKEGCSLRKWNCPLSFVATGPHC